jgi:hypothetical protein
MIVVLFLTYSNLFGQDATDSVINSSLLNNDSSFMIKEDYTSFDYVYLDDKIVIPADSIVESQPRRYKDYWLIILKGYNNTTFLTITKAELGEYLYRNKENGYKNMASIIHNKIVLVRDESNLIKYYDDMKFMIKTKGLIISDPGFKDESYWVFKVGETKSLLIKKGF